MSILLSQYCLLVVSKKEYLVSAWKILNTLLKCISELICCLVCRLEAQGVHVTRQRVRDCMERVDPSGAALRALRSKVRKRRVYKVAGPNSLWHAGEI